MKKIMGLFLFSFAALCSASHVVDSEVIALTTQENVLYQKLVQMNSSTSFNVSSIEKLHVSIDGLCELLLKRKYILLAEIKDASQYIKHSLGLCKYICGASFFAAAGGGVFLHALPKIDHEVQSILPFCNTLMANIAQQLPTLQQVFPQAVSMFQSINQQLLQAINAGIPPAYDLIKKECYVAAGLTTAVGVVGLVWGGYKMLYYRNYIPQRRQEIAVINEIMKKLLVLKTA